MRHEALVLLPTAAMIVAVAVLLMPLAAADAEGYDADLGDMYSMSVQFRFTGSDAESVEWDFGDGTQPSTEWDPMHTYAEKGVYIVTQKAWNSYNNGSESVMTFRISILGYPEIVFDTHGGAPVDAIAMTSPNGVAPCPEDPSRTGYSFTGWYADPECAVPYDWSSEVRRSMTLHAGWTPEETPRCTVSFDVDGGDETVADIAVEQGAPMEVPGYGGSKEGFAFSGWLLGDELLGPGSVISVDGDMTLRACWTETASEKGSGGSAGFVEENLLTVAAAIAALIAAALIAIRMGKA